jgi:hypothetical protein
VQNEEKVKPGPSNYNNSPKGVIFGGTVSKTVRSGYFEEIEYLGNCVPWSANPNVRNNTYKCRKI